MKIYKENMRCLGGARPRYKNHKKEQRTILIQEYAHFNLKYDGLTEIYDRFLTLLNDLSLVGKKYDNEYSNTKFRLALPE